MTRNEQPRIYADRRSVADSSRDARNNSPGTTRGAAAMGEDRAKRRQRLTRAGARGADGFIRRETASRLRQYASFCFGTSPSRCFVARQHEEATSCLPKTQGVRGGAGTAPAARFGLRRRALARRQRLSAFRSSRHRSAADSRESRVAKFGYTSVGSTLPSSQ
jgi:hypothetical protein